jgi:hydrogenase maturation factor
MCIARVGRVVHAADGRATVEFFDGRTADGVDVSMVKAAEGSFVEVFGNLALSNLTARQARGRKAAWTEVREAAMKLEA